MALSDIVVYAPHRAYQKFTTGGYTGNVGATSLAAASIATCLTQANWANIGGTFSQTTLVFPLAIGIGLACIWQGFAFVFYNSGAGQTPPTTYTDSFGNVWPVIGVDTASGSPLTNLAAAMSGWGFSCTVIGGNTVLVTALAAGSLWDNRPLQGSGSFSVSAGSTCGGGFTLQSNSELGENGLIAGNGASCQLTAQSDPGHQGELIVTIQPLGVTGTGTPVVYNFAIGQWILIANDFNAFFCCYGPQGLPDLNVGNNNLWFVAPLLIPSQQNAPTAACFVAVGQVQESTYPVYEWIGSSYAASGWGQRGCSLINYRLPSPAGELFTLAGQSLLTPAIVQMYTAAGAGGGGWIGLIADAFIDSHYSAPFAQASIPDTAGSPLTITYRAVSGQNSASETIHTLWLGSGEAGPFDPGTGGNGGTGVGGGPGAGPVGNPPSNNITVTPGAIGIAIQAGKQATTGMSISSSATTPIPIALGLSGIGWFTFETVSGFQVSIGQTISIVFLANATSTGPGQYGANVTITPTGFSPLTIPVTILVYSGTPAQGGTGLAGIVSTQGPQVYLQSGNSFNSAMVGFPIIIEGMAYVVTGFSSATNIQVAPNPPASTDVPYNT